MATNEKLQHLLEEAVSQAYKQRVKEANTKYPRKRIIQRLRLYGIGFGGRLPRVSKKRQSNEVDQETLAMVKAGCTLGRCTSTFHVHPPEVPLWATGELRYAHEDLFKYFSHGSLSKNDPERFFISSIGGNADFAGGHRPAWYFGISDKATDQTRPLDAAQRYGYRGSQALRDYNIPRTGAPYRTLREDAPAFLRPHEHTVVDEWTPPIIAQPQLNKEPFFCSPKLWPSNTEYVEGYKHKHKSDSKVYNAETTVNDRCKTAPDPKILRSVELEQEVKDALNDGMVAERHSLISFNTTSKGLRRPSAVTRRRGLVSRDIGTSKPSKQSHPEDRTATSSGIEADASIAQTEDVSSTSMAMTQEQMSSSLSLLPGGRSVAGRSENNGQASNLLPSSSTSPSLEKHRPMTSSSQKKEKKRGRHHLQHLAATKSYQDRRVGAKMQPARSETILIKRRDVTVVSSSTGSKGKRRESRDSTSSAMVQYELKWHAIRHLYDVILNSRLPGRPGTSVNLVASLCTHLQAHANANEAKTMISRDAFITALLGKYGSRMHDAKANLIFSIFDPMNHNRIHYAHVIACLSILEYPNETARKKLQRLWRLYKENRRDRNALENLVAIMTTCSSSISDFSNMESLVKGELIPYCYRTIAFKSPSALEAAGASTSKIQMLRQQSFGGSARMLATTPDNSINAVKRRASDSRIGVPLSEGGGPRGGGSAGSGSSGSKPTEGRGAASDSSQIEVVYNICNDMMEEEDFGEALAACPRVVALFDDHMKTVLRRERDRSSGRESNDKGGRRTSTSSERRRSNVTDRGRSASLASTGAGGRDGEGGEEEEEEEEEDGDQDEDGGRTLEEYGYY